MKLSDYTECWYIPGEHFTQDLIHPVTGLTHCFDKSPEQVLAESPTAIRVNFDRACYWIGVLSAHKYCTGPEEIDAERFQEMLEILPPVNWTNHSGGESFKMCELLTGDITSIFVRIGSRYFTLNGSIKKPHAEIVAECAAFMTGEPTP